MISSLSTVQARAACISASPELMRGSSSLPSCEGDTSSGTASNCYQAPAPEVSPECLQCTGLSSNTVSSLNDLVAACFGTWVSWTISSVS